MVRSRNFFAYFDAKDLHNIFWFLNSIGIEKNMRLEEFHTEPSRMALLNYGNTSSSSIWYEMEYIMETQKNNPLKKGDRVMQVAFGSGFKCTSGVWLKL
jgi:3-ketoacyl-CoA synthase